MLTITAAAILTVAMTFIGFFLGYIFTREQYLKTQREYNRYDLEQRRKSQRDHKYSDPRRYRYPNRWKR